MPFATAAFDSMCGRWRVAKNACGLVSVCGKFWYARYVHSTGQAARDNITSHSTATLHLRNQVNIIDICESMSSCSLISNMTSPLGLFPRSRKLQSAINRASQGEPVPHVRML